MTNELAFFIGAFFFISFLGWRIERRLRELIILTKRKKTHFPHTYLDHARNEKGYETISNANYWLLLAVISILSDEEF